MRAFRSVLFLLATCLLATSVLAQRSMDDVQIDVQHVKGSIHVLYGAGGNIGACIGDDGVFLIDDQFAPLTDKILAALGTLTQKDVRFVINTHWHRDHTGGNENLGKRGAIIVAHENVRKRLSSDQFVRAFGAEVPAKPDVAKPVITFGDRVTFHWNDETIHVFHVPNAHTDGDSVIHFVDSDVIHAGDVVFNGMYPFIDDSSGGVIGSTIAAVDRILGLCGPETLIIPGHGRVTTPAGLREYRSMLADVERKINRLMRRRRTVEEIVAAKPTADHDAKWGGGFLKPDQWVEIVATGMKNAKERGR
ncbi:MAG: MBL fold metallo-hydrolase [Acidobacteriota bacterium]